jgi:3-oxoadipate enol-lactonase
MDRYVEVAGGRLFLVSDGDGPPIVLIHAAIADHRAWDAMVPLIVAAGYRAIRYDLRGFGRTTTEDVEFSNRQDVIAVLDALGIERAVLVGNSRGGQIAFDTAIEFPERIAAVVGVAAGLGGFEAEPAPDELALYAEMDRVEGADPPDVEAIVELDVRAWVNGPGQPSDRVEARIQDAIRMMDRAQYEVGHVNGRPIRLQPPAADRLAELSCPVLAVAGLLDFSEVAQTARHLDAHAPDARAIVLPGVAHMIGMEVPDELAELIVEFVAPLRPWA